MRQLRARNAALKKWLRWRRGRKHHPSIHFYTVHKAASSLFGGRILGAIPGRRHIDDEARIYRGRLRMPLRFEESGYVYGPIRISREPTTRLDARYQQIVSRSDFVRDRRLVCLIRDPRDILVSSYYSFGFSHGLSPDPEFARHQREHRDWAQSKTVDEYCLQRAPAMNEIFQRLGELLETAGDATLLRYEDMIDDWESFAPKLSRCLELDEHALQILYRRSRPRKRENLQRHRRSGRPGGFREKLSPDTVAELDRILGDVLDRFGYQR